MSLHPVFPGVSLINLPWVNAWLLHKDNEAVLIDTGTRWDRKRLLSALPRGSRFTSVLLTHGHCDHAGNAAFLADHCGARLIAHEEEVVFMETRRTYVPRGMGALSASGLLFAAGEVVFPVRRHKVDRIVQEGDRIETPIGPLTVLHTPGHTPGHVSYLHEGEGWLFSGDALINVIPWVRRTGLCLPVPVFTSDIEAGHRSARRIAELGPAALLAGHGWPLVQDTAAAIRSFIARALPG
jgi:glyoxylase-like metal-dependent hydrolase (beta-lactamase superfamily II)